MDLYRGALKDARNWIPDQHGALHRRPGTMFVDKLKGKPCKYRFDAGADCLTTMVATDQCLSFYVDGEKFGDDLAVDYADPDYCNLSVANDCGALFIAHPNYPPRLLAKGENGFELKDFPRLPYASLNDDETCRICVEDGGTAATGTMTLATDEATTGDTLDIVDPDGNTLGTVLLGDFLGNNTYEVPFVSGVLTGQYVDQNGDAIFIQANGATVTAIGCEPFTENMVGQFLRVLDEVGTCRSSELVEIATYNDVGAGNGSYDLIDGAYVFVGAGNGQFDQVVTSQSQPSDTDVNEPNTWLSLQVIEFVSSTEIVVAYSGCELKCTDLFCLPAFSDGVYPNAVWVHQDRLWFAYGNEYVGSKAGDFFDWEKTDPDGSVNPDNAIYGTLDAGECQDIKWMRTVDRYLVLGTNRSIYALGGSQGALAADDSVAQLIQSVGVADIEPVEVGNRSIFVDRTCTRVYFVAPAAEYDQLTAQELTVFADHLGGRRIRSMAFMEIPFPLIWVVFEDGTFASLTHLPSQGVRAWAPHELGGTLVVDGCCKAPEVCDIEVQRTSDDKRDIVYFSVARTMSGRDVFTLETLGEFFGHFTKIEDAHHVDCAVRTGDSRPLESGADWSALVAFSSLPPGPVAICDADRWYYGESDGTSVTLDRPNSGEAVAGRSFVDRGDGYVLLEKDTCAVSPEYIGPDVCIYTPPCAPSHYCIQQDQLEGLECLEGETVAAYVDGEFCGCHVVEGGRVPVSGCVSLVGYPFVSWADFLPWRADFGVTDGSADTSRVVSVWADVYRTPSLYGVIKEADHYLRLSEKVSQMVEQEQGFGGGVTLKTGWVQAAVSSSNQVNDGGGFCIRAVGPHPAIVRGVKPIYDGQVRQ